MQQIIRRENGSAKLYYISPTCIIKLVYIKRESCMRYFRKCYGKLRVINCLFCLCIIVQILMYRPVLSTKNMQILHYDENKAWFFFSPAAYTSYKVLQLYSPRACTLFLSYESLYFSFFPSIFTTHGHCHICTHDTCDLSPEQAKYIFLFILNSSFLKKNPHIYFGMSPLHVQYIHVKITEHKNHSTLYQYVELVVFSPVIDFLNASHPCTLPVNIMEYSMIPAFILLWCILRCIVVMRKNKKNLHLHWLFLSHCP